MIVRRLPLAVLLFAGLAAAAAPESVQQAFDRYRRQIAMAPKTMVRQFDRMVIKDLQDKYRDLAGVLTEADSSVPAASAPAPETLPQSESIEKRGGSLGSLPTDTDRAKVVLALAGEIRVLPAGTEKIILADGLCTLAMDGDLGKAPVDAAVSTLAQSLREVPVSLGGAYLNLASLVRYEHVTPPPADPALHAATAILELRDAMRQEAGFTLTALDGKTYSLGSLRGHVVLLSFWATWCQPCRSEMPDLEKLYRRLGPKGLIVLAVSDEKRETVEGSLEVERIVSKQTYTLPILLDPDRKVNTTYFVKSIPHSFLFSREGKLVAQSISVQTEGQLLEMFKSAGLE
jgi:thiol-disulfide isomerase/thioredoxin